MSKKNKPDNNGFVYSTDPEFKFKTENAGVHTLLPAQQQLSIWLDTKHRAGKPVTLIKGYIGKQNDLEELGKKLKSFCGTGGSVKEGEIIVQGDQREKVMLWFFKNGYKSIKKR